MRGEGRGAVSSSWGARALRGELVQPPLSSSQGTALSRGGGGREGLAALRRRAPPKQPSAPLCGREDPQCSRVAPRGTSNSKFTSSRLTWGWGGCPGIWCYSSQKFVTSTGLAVMPQMWRSYNISETIRKEFHKVRITGLIWSLCDGHFCIFCLCFVAFCFYFEASCFILS